MTVAHHGSVARRALPYAVSLLALAAAAGCTAGSPPSAPSSAALTTTAASTTTSQAPTPTATPTADPAIAKIPAAARPETMAGAEAFAKYYFEQLNRSFRAGSPALLDGLYSDSCATCSDLRASADELEAKGLRHDGDTLTVTFSSATIFNTKSRQVLVKLDQHAVPVVNAAGHEVEKTRSGSGAFVVVLAYESHWVVTDLGRPS